MTDLDNVAKRPHDHPAVLVTGAAGYVGSHAVSQLLRHGYAVRAAVRSQQRAQEVRDVVASQGLDPHNVNFVVADLNADEGWREAVAGTQYVLHIASPFPAEAPQKDEDVIVPAREGTLRVLRHARAAGCIKVVLTSSFAAVGYSPKAGDRWSEQDWTDPNGDNTAYIRSKAIAERAAWDFMEDNGADLQLTTLVPVGIFGPTIGTRLSTSVKFVQTMLTGELQRLLPQHFGVVDVRDVAAAHIAALANSRASGQRILLVADGPPLSFLGIARILHGGLGAAASRVTTDQYSEDEVRHLAATVPAVREALTQLGKRPQISNSKAKSVLGWSPRPVTETILDTARSLIERDLV